MGIGDWGLGIGPNPQSPIPNPQSPIPNPQRRLLINFNYKIKLSQVYYLKNKYFLFISKYGIRFTPS